MKALLLKRKNNSNGGDMFLSDLEKELTQRGFKFTGSNGGRWFYEGTRTGKKAIVDNNFSDMIDGGNSIFTEVVRVDEKEKSITIFSRAVNEKMLVAGLEKLRIL